MLDDGLGRLWVGSHKGIFHLPKTAFQYLDQHEIETLPCVAYGLHDGLPTLECTGNYQPSCWRSRDGLLWFATVKGLVSINPTETSANPVPPPVRIEEVLVNGKAIESGKAQHRSSPSSILHSSPSFRIPPGRHQLDFRYTALSFTAPDKVRFRYRLAGFDNDWVEADSKRTAHYGPLPPGEYDFEVAACNNDGIWNMRGATIGLKVLPQFWQTLWFQGVATAGIIGVIFATVRITATRRLHRKLELLKQQRAIERERQRIAKDIHDDLGAGLTQIVMQSSLARRESQGQVHTDLTQISDTARELVRDMDEIVWAINPENDTLDDLASYVGKFVQDFVGATGKRCRIIVPTQLPSQTVSAEARHNLFLAIKEALNNAAKHSNATKISFQLNVQPSAVTFVVKDNGCGFNLNAMNGSAIDGSRISSGHGLRNMARRLEDLGGSCAIKSTPGQGTTVELTMRLHKTNHIRQ